MTRRDEVVVSTDWLQAHLDDPNVIAVEVDERPLVYRSSHIPGAYCLEWHTDLQDPVTRDIPAPEAMAAVWRRIGMTKDSVIVFYGDRNNWYAAFAFWLFRFYGAQNLRLLDGGRAAWLSENRVTDEAVPDEHTESSRKTPVPRTHPSLRAGWQDALEAIGDGVQLVDVRTPAEFHGDAYTEPGYSSERAQRAGRIPTAKNVPWDVTIDDRGLLRSASDLKRVFHDCGIDLKSPIITYCRIGERSAHTWFVLHELLGASARNYDGSWAEWGSMIGMPVETGDPS